MNKPAQTHVESRVKKGLPWYRYRTVWVFLVAIPLLTLVASGMTIYLAVSSSESGAHDSYFKKGLSPNELAPREQIAKERNLSADLSLTDSHLVVTFNQPVHRPKLEIKFQHPTLEKRDFRVPIYPADTSKNTVFQVKKPTNLRDNTWDIFVDSPDDGWRIKGRLLRRETHIPLGPFGQ